jgi:site-specific recombinase XerD
LNWYEMTTLNRQRLSWDMSPATCRGGSLIPMRVTDRRLAPRNVAAIVKQGAARLGFDPSTFGGHSLRAGFVTSAVKRGANLIKITDVTGHKSLEMLKTYGRDAEAFVRHAGAGLL